MPEIPLLSFPARNPPYVTTANTPGISQLPSLLREDDRAVFGDVCYVHNGPKRAARDADVLWGVALSTYYLIRSCVNIEKSLRRPVREPFLLPSEK